MKTIFTWKLGLLAVVLFRIGNGAPIDELDSGNNEDRDSKTIGLLIALGDAEWKRKINFETSQYKFLGGALPKITIEFGNTVSGDILALIDDNDDDSTQGKPLPKVTVANNLKIAYGKNLITSDVSKPKNIKETIFREELMASNEEAGGLQSNVDENTERNAARREKRQSKQMGTEDTKNQSIEDLNESRTIESSTSTEETMTTTVILPTTSATVFSSTTSGTPGTRYGPPPSAVPSGSYSPPPPAISGSAYGPPSSAIPSSSYSPTPPILPNSSYGAPSPTAPSNSWSMTYPSSSISTHPSYGPPNLVWTLGYGPSSIKNINEITLTQDHFPASGERRHYRVYPSSSNYYAFPYFPLHSYYSHHFKPSYPDHFRNFWDWSSSNFVPIHVNQWQSTPLWPASDFNAGNFK